ncbi:metal ABC transporter substrate-binding protein [Peptoniphilus sp. oral taxon 386]|uniref:metal ABC transporter substrate-binding protein n=2 Tax=Peptoniphilus sp. oral taxon 386 TaxID=652713 RepID=UPI0001DA9CCF|nr:metal ABC transporter substrate-binding protein [Peptoniphilus sp. oral taxon 386]EFI42674.1 ABC transporter, substrate-binding protein [Peptoniphilus sp. oral taxon 386 str. F0131]
MNRKLKLFSIIIALIVFTVGCGNVGDKNNKTDEETEGKLKVYASIYPMYDFAGKIGGDKIDLNLVIPNGQEPHDWEPSQDDIKKLENADVFIYNGAGLESWTDDVLSSINNKDLAVVEASDRIELIEGHHHHHEEHEEAKEHNHHHEEHEHGLDPHVWISPKNAIIELENIAKAFSEKDPENAQYYNANLEKYKAEFEQLDKLYAEELAKVPNRTIVVSHEAYGYLCHEYGLEQVGIEGVNAESEPDAKTMAQIIEFVREKGINTIFTEELIEPKVADTIAAETGAKTVVLSPLEALSEEEIEAKADYVSIMKSNLEKLVEALK